ncbi:MAG: dienelactone hydrolase family protein [Candidatus Kariarchaeaceae archaeon]|jgi:carboxymethylenebutenolidase
MGEFTKIRNDPPLPTYVAKPEGEGPHPTIFLFMHAHGVDSSQQKVCDDLAKAGFMVIGGDAYQEGKFNFQTQTDDLIFDTFDFVYKYAKSLADVDTNRLGLIGFCMGGRHSYLANVKYSDFKAVVSYYGFPHRGETPDVTPQNLVDQFHGPVLSIFGAKDQGIPIEAVEAYQKASEVEGTTHRSVVYQNAGHGFLNPDSANYDSEASKSAWQETLKHFNQFLK